MTVTADSSDVPYLNEILEYLPIDATDKEDISTYINNITDVIAINYKYGQYQFAYFGVHLLYMTYIYCTIWKISMINPVRYSDAVVFVRPYNSREKDLNIDNISSIFEYSLVPEKDISKIFKIIDLHKSQISNVSGLVDIRNDMAHASGKFEILTENSFNVRANTVLSSIRNIHVCMDKQIRMWFKDTLIKYNTDESSEYSTIEDIIYEQMIQTFNLSVKELLVCNEMSIRGLVSSNPDLDEKLKLFKYELKSFCEDKGYT